MPTVRPRWHASDTFPARGADFRAGNAAGVRDRRTLNPLARAYDAPFDPPRTVGDVIGLYRGGRLREIRGLGQRRISEIAAALVLADLDITAGSQEPQDATESGKAGEGP
jgi:hypothetical protein